MFRFRRTILFCAITLLLPFAVAAQFQASEGGECLSDKDCAEGLTCGKDASRTFIPPRLTCLSQTVLCTDTDAANAENPWVQGTARKVQGGKILEEQTDTCTEDGERIIEYYCDGGVTFTKLEMLCVNGCAEGRCLSNTPQPTSNPVEQVRTNPEREPKQMTPNDGLKQRLCERVVKNFSTNEKMWQRVNDRVEKRFGYRCMRSTAGRSMSAVSTAMTKVQNVVFENVSDGEFNNDLGDPWIISGSVSIEINATDANGMVPLTEDPDNRLVQLKWFPFASISQPIALDALPRALTFISHGQLGNSQDSLEVVYQVNGGQKYILKKFRIGTDPMQQAYLPFPPATRNTHGTLIFEAIGHGGSVTRFDKINVIEDIGR